MDATNALIVYLELLAQEENCGKLKIQNFDLSQFMRLDSAAAEALNLLPKKGQEAKTNNLFGLLSAHCKTNIGSRKCMRWIRQPLLDKQEIGKRINYNNYLCSCCHEISFEPCELREFNFNFFLFLR